ncbi:unnamed protein product [Discosporangium mesarthrocarpum]
MYAVPNDGQSELLNAEDMPGRIVLVDRGEVPILEKVLRAQAAGAVGVIVADNGGCSADLTDCGRVGGVKDGGFARKDGARVWLSITVPVAMVTQHAGTRFKGMMALRAVEVPGLGEQLVER